MDRIIGELIAERRRQIDEEGFDAAHDDEHRFGEMAYAAGCYAFASRGKFLARAARQIIDDLWPWSKPWWKPTTPRQDLIKAGALIIAELERLDRAAAKQTSPAGEQ